MTVDIYTDGAVQGNPGTGGWAAVLRYGDNEREISGHEEYATNQQMELRAAVEALRTLKRPCRVRLYSDSSYLVNCMNQGWIDRWETNGWLTGKKEPVKNVALWLALAKASEPHDVEWVWVKGHADDDGNNRADKLAHASARSAC